MVTLLLGKDKACRAVSCTTAHQLSPLTSAFSSFILPRPLLCQTSSATDPPSTVCPGRKDISRTVETVPTCSSPISNLLSPSEGYREGYPYDVSVSRLENEGFGFVIISSVSRAGSTIGRIIPGKKTFDILLLLNFLSDVKCRVTDVNLALKGFVFIPKMWPQFPRGPHWCHRGRNAFSKLQQPKILARNLIQSCRK